MIKVSVIMPVYNEEAYLMDALEGYTKQTLLGKELICVDDGSSDNSVNIIEEYRTAHSDIKLIRQDRKGAGAARNLAMKYAQGEYICFLDADDFYVDEMALEALYNSAAKENALVCAGMLQIYSQQGIVKDPMLRGLIVNNMPTKVKYIDFQFDYQYQCFLFNRKYINSYHIEFPLYKRFQDPPFFVQALYFANEFIVLPIEFYGYRSGYKVIKYSEDKVYDLFQGIMFDLKFSHQYQLEKLFDRTMSRINRSYFNVLYDGLKTTNKPLLKLMLEAGELAETLGYRIEPLEALFYSKETNVNFNTENFTYYVKVNSLIPKAGRVVIYGAGEIGKKVFSIIKGNKKYDLVGWIDKNKTGSEYEGFSIVDLDALVYMKYDYVLIAVKRAEVVEEIEQDLDKIGVDRKHIIRWN